jgi:hypothetical protein
LRLLFFHPDFDRRLRIFTESAIAWRKGARARRHFCRITAGVDFRHPLKNRLRCASVAGFTYHSTLHEVCQRIFWAKGIDWAPANEFFLHFLPRYVIIKST